MSHESVQARAIFIDAVENVPPERWREYLDEACGADETLRDKVQRLLDAHGATGSFMDKLAAAPVATIDQPITEKPGTQIGPYKLLQQLGEGGMGVVYMAEQKEPVKRRVALKIIKPGMDTRQVIARFEAERQALAMMDHPNIAKVLDAGATESGRPYFVMELVNGLPVTKYCDEQHLTPKERLELFVPICQAVQHAHQKGIIHRDLKPSNILVALYDGRPVPKVIDFGVAKATSQTLTEKTMFTQLGQVVGTLEYMSPEQAERNQLDIDTRSDIYSLGVVLYELLTGDTPFDRTRLRSAAFDEMLRIIREEEPSKPSTKVSSSQSLPSIAANRRIEPAKLGSVIRGELDWIVLKAMEKDRGRRYETASKFAEDVQHYLNDEAVVACPPSRAYQLRKFVRRNQAAIGLSATVLAASMVVMASIGWAMRDRAARENALARSQAEQRDELARRIDMILDNVDRLTEQDEWAKALAEVRRAETAVEGANTDPTMRNRVADLLGDLRLVNDLKQARLLESRMVQGDWDLAAAERAHAQAFVNAGIILDALTVAEAEETLRRRHRIINELAVALTNWSRLRRTLEKKKRHPEQVSGGLSWQHLLDIADTIDGDMWRRRLRTIWHDEDASGTRLQGLVDTELPDSLAAPTALLIAKALRDDVSANAAAEFLLDIHRDHLGDFTINYELGTVLQMVSRPNEALVYCSMALAIRPEYAGVHVNLGNVLDDLGRQEDARRNYLSAIELAPRLAAAHCNLGLLAKREGKLDEAIQLYRKAIELGPPSPIFHKNLASALRENDPREAAIAQYRAALELDSEDAATHHDLGLPLAGNGQLEEAILCYQRAIAIDPDVALYHYNLANALRDAYQTSAAIESYLRAVEIKPTYAGAHHNLGWVLEHEQRLEEALVSYQKALEHDPENGLSYRGLGRVYAKMGKLKEAAQSFRDAIEANPNDAASHQNLGLTLKRQGDLNGAIKCFRRAIRLAPDQPDFHGNLGSALKANGDREAAVQNFEKQAELDPENVLLHTNLAWEYATNQQVGQRDPQKAVAHATKAVELAPDSSNHWCNLGVALYRAGKWSESVEALNNVPGGLGDLYHRFFLAMAYWQLEDGENARHCYREALAYWYEKKREDQQLMRFRDEAEQLFGITVKERESLLENSKQILIDYYTQIAEHDPKYSEAFRKRGDLYRDTRQPEKAIADYSVVLKARPNDADAWHRRGSSHCRLKNWQQALDDIDRAIDLDPTSWMYSERAWPLIMLGRYEGAVSDCNRALEQNPKNATAMNRRSWARASLGQIGLAVADAVAAVIMEPSSKWHWIRLRNCAREAHNSEHLACLDDLHQHLEKNPRALAGHAENLAELDDLRASLNSKEDEPQAAID